MADRFILSHIQRLPMFARCTDDQLAAFADAFLERNYRPGEVLYTQGEDSHTMYVFVSGSGQLYRGNQPQGTIMPGQYVGESSLFNHAARDATVMVNADSAVIYITRDALIQAVNARPELRSVLNERPEWIDSLPGAPLSAVSTSRGAIAPNTNVPAYPSTPYAPNQSTQYPQVPQPVFTSQAAYPDPHAPAGQPYPSQYPAQAPQYPPQSYQNPAPSTSNQGNETVLLHTRRHLWTVGGKTIGAMIVVAISLSAIVLASKSPAGLRNAIDAFGGLAAVVAGFMVAFWLVEWFGDTFTVTTTRIVHNLRVFPSGAETREQALLSSVQSVDVTRSGYLADILGFGDLLIAVLGTRQPMVLDHIPHPVAAQQLILQQVQRAGVDPALLQAGALPPPIVGGIPQYSAPIRTNGRFWPHTREVIGDRIIYRKHWGVLIGYELKPIVSYILWMLFLTLRSTAIGNLAAAFSLSILDTLSAAWVILTTFWVIWEYLRWYNDLYILDSETVVDIVRQPFGLREVRIQAGLPQIQNVTSEVHSLWGTFFNFGDVLIQTAAQQGQMIFYGVHNPTGVADEILQHVRDYGTNRITQEQSMNREAFSDALAGYRPGLPPTQTPGYPQQQQPYVQPQPYPQQPYEVPPNASQYPQSNAAQYPSQYPPAPTEQPSNVRYPRVPPQNYDPRNGPQR